VEEVEVVNLHLVVWEEKEEVVQEVQMQLVFQEQQILEVAAVALALKDRGRPMTDGVVTVQPD
jgi:hypothetical protein